VRLKLVVRLKLSVRLRLVYGRNLVQVCDRSLMLKLSAPLDHFQDFSRIPLGFNTMASFQSPMLRYSDREAPQMSGETIFHLLSDFFDV
jgi:hypothetical protein